ncbi:Hypothetical protein NTJ_08806 [Nesidiocoris tenuis]|uniref:Uncharacterized protein n=1 Tax=Nesidiocoris tenuis TaxID=355587 RepID=A0ABN7AUY5_9HEMI|nr:Hypothetical protein NTJ_08806 [Nesidiocoris tenuis]
MPIGNGGTFQAIVSIPPVMPTMRNVICGENQEEEEEELFRSEVHGHLLVELLASRGASASKGPPKIAPVLSAIWLLTNSAVYGRIVGPIVDPEGALTVYKMKHWRWRDNSECTLSYGGYFPFVVKVGQGKIEWKQLEWFQRQHKHWTKDMSVQATGNILTPVFVLTACTPFPDDDKIINNVIVMASADTKAPTMSPDLANNREKFITNQRPHYNPPLATLFFGDTEEFRCRQVRDVNAFYRHKLCDYKNTHPNTERYNFMVLRLNYTLWAAWPNANYTYWTRQEYAHMNLVPTLPLPSNYERNMELVNAFNSRRNMRCQVPRILKDTLQTGFRQHSMLRSLPMHLECARALCRAAVATNDSGYVFLYKQAICMKDLYSLNGTLVCATVVKDTNYNYVDDRPPVDYWGDHGPGGTDVHGNYPKSYSCRDEGYILGAPVACRGEILGFVTGCYDYYYIISTALPVWNFILRFITSPRLPELYMDQKKKPDTRYMPPFWHPPLPFDPEYQLFYRERRQAASGPKI